MDILNKIQELLESNNIEDAYNFIIENEEKLMHSPEYWNLRGMLCFKIGEYDAAIGCYKTSIGIKCDYIDGYFNLIFTYKLLGEKLKSAMYCGIALRHTSDLNFMSDIKKLYVDEVLSNKFYEILEEVKNNMNIEGDEIGLINYIASKFNNIDKEYVENLAKDGIAKSWAYVEKDVVITNREIVKVEDFVSHEEINKYNIIVPYDINYIDVVRSLSKHWVRECYIIIPSNHKLDLIEIDNAIMTALRDEEYKRTITLNEFNAADANVYALKKYMPEKYKGTYKLNMIYGRDVYDIANIVRVPLISSVTISGFNTFVNYPKFTYNIDVGHGDVAFKACGLMDKKNKQFAFTPKEYESIDKICTISTMATVIKSAFSAIPEDKYEITGNPRTDILCLSNGKENLEKLLNMKLDNKKIIFNMPTFHTHENSGVVNGSQELNDSIKIKGFNYEKFDDFLKTNNIICISKVHHGEERTVTNKTKSRELSNLKFISNEDLESCGLNLYEILNAAHLLLTDYSTIYGDFLFMNKPIIFINTDIDEYREKKGLMLEPYDFWAAGPKVQKRDTLEIEILKCLRDENYYKNERDTIKNVFYYYKDSKASLRVWDFIHRVLGKELIDG